MFSLIFSASHFICSYKIMCFIEKLSCRLTKKEKAFLHEQQREQQQQQQQQHYKENNNNGKRSM